MPNIILNPFYPRALKRLVIRGLIHLSTNHLLVITVNISSIKAVVCVRFMEMHAGPMIAGSVHWKWLGESCKLHSMQKRLGNEAELLIINAVLNP